jgi:uncharacterized membrane protein YhaH (DUF805 family)/uncharacterized membrane protein YphA (DoxX/SURF4 family)
VLVSHVLLLVAYIAAFRPMLVASASLSGAFQAPSLQQLMRAARLLLGAWMLLNGVNHFFFSWWTMPAGQTVLSAQLMTALVNSQLMDVCMLIELVAGALILLGVFVPAALCVLMSVTTSGLYWTLLDHQPMSLALGVLAFALNGVLLLAYLPHYRGMLQRAPLTLGETEQHTSFNALFVHPGGRTARKHFVWALLPLLVATLWYVNKGPAANYVAWGILTLLYPAVVLHVRRLHDMGHTGWLMLVPTLLTVVAMGIWANRIDLGAQLNSAVPLTAGLVFAGFALWGCIAKGRAEANRFGAPVAA